MTFFEDDMTIEVEFDELPQISVGNVKIHLQETAEGVLITAEDAEGKEQALVRNGTPGAPGDPGYTPVKGKDYWTAADKAEMVTAVLAALPVYGGEYA